MDANQDLSDRNVDFGDVVGRDFLDKFLLAIIDAYPLAGTSPVSAERARMARLKLAKEALLAQSSISGRSEVFDDTVLRWMGHEHYRDLAARSRFTSEKLRANGKVRSDRQLAMEAVKKFGLPGNADERLRSKFGKQRERWLSVAQNHDDVPEQLDFNLLEQLQGIFAKRDVRMVLSVDHKT